MATSTQIETNGARTEREADSGCCGGAAPEGTDACCALDAEVKSTGGSGCGCAPKTAAATAKKKGCC